MHKEHDVPYLDSRIFLVKMKGEELYNGVTYMCGRCQQKTRHLYITCRDLEAGDYILFTEIDLPETLQYEKLISS